MPSVTHFLTAALYKFVDLPDFADLQVPLQACCEANDVKGTLLLAHEGINGTIAGADAGIEAVLATIRALPGFADTRIRRARAEVPPFHRLKVRAKREIVTLGVPVDPAAAGPRVAPADWNDFVSAPGTLLIDTRNDYEVAIGSFAGAIDPDTPRFADFPAWVAANRDKLAAAPRIAMFCTGGIRCEKATALLREQGFGDVHHLEGGILAYLETVPAAASRWQGECFVFDERVAVGHGLAPGSHDLCRGCRMPVSPADRESHLFVEGVACPRCHHRRDAAQHAGAAERHRQAALAAARGTVHIGAAPPR